MKRKLVSVSVLLLAMAPNSQAAEPATFTSETTFLKQHTGLLILQDKSGSAKIAVAPAWQGRVMTSTAEGDKGLSFGWLNHELIASGKLQPHINVFGGEDRFWIGPEGGQFSVFFPKGAAFDLQDWFTPAPIDTVPYQVADKTASQATFIARFMLTNYSGTTFDVKVERIVRVLEAESAWQALGLSPNHAVKMVAYESDNRISNAGQQPWKKTTGLLSIWILGQFNPSPSTTIVVPIKPGPESELGTKVTSDYFGPVPADRLAVRDNVVFLKGDGQFRSKIGVSPKRSRQVLGSYDAQHGVLTIVRFSQVPGVTDYVNSLWKIQENPYAGDAANSYNDGPPAPGAKPLGPFYELESSSPAAALEPGAALSHVHRTFHLTGAEAELDAVARKVLGLSLKEIKTAFVKPQ